MTTNLSARIRRYYLDDATEAGWVADFGVAESQAARCQHSLKVGRCTMRVCDCRDYAHDFLDHARMWRYPDGRLFLLAHIYDWDADKEGAARDWAAKFGLSWAVLAPDGWYGYGTTPVRFWYEPGVRVAMGRFAPWSLADGPGFIQ